MIRKILKSMSLSLTFLYIFAINVFAIGPAQMTMFEKFFFAIIAVAEFYLCLLTISSAIVILKIILLKIYEKTLAPEDRTFNKRPTTKCIWFYLIAILMICEPIMNYVVTGFICEKFILISILSFLHLKFISNRLRIEKEELNIKEKSLNVWIANTNVIFYITTILLAFGIFLENGYIYSGSINHLFLMLMAIIALSTSIYSWRHKEYLFAIISIIPITTFVAYLNLIIAF